jgi:hypothetical protein
LITSKPLVWQAITLRSWWLCCSDVGDAAGQVRRISFLASGTALGANLMRLAGAVSSGDLFLVGSTGLRDG